jgi:small redox-active disulfide protein 2
MRALAMSLPVSNSKANKSLHFRIKDSTMDIKVLGTGCANCKATIALIEQIAQAKGVPVTLGKVEELRDIMGYGVMSTPGVVINGKVVHAGGIPSRDKIEKWLAA